MTKKCNHVSSLFLVWPKSFTSGAQINCLAYLWIRSLPVLVYFDCRGPCGPTSSPGRFNPGTGALWERGCVRPPTSSPRRFSLALEVVSRGPISKAREKRPEDEVACGLQWVRDSIWCVVVIVTHWPGTVWWSVGNFRREKILTKFECAKFNTHKENTTHNEHVIIATTQQHIH